MTKNSSDNASYQLSQAVFMLVRGSRYPDPIMCSAILALPSLIERLLVAQINPWVRRAEDQFISTAGSEPTAASIIETTSRMFSLLLTPSAIKDISDSEIMARYNEAELLLPMSNSSKFASSSSTQLVAGFAPWMNLSGSL